ncbi:hypothetical protein [Brevibacillus borstelensis]|uniref:hypothetical protein n=1 Tax=Brevibacillus borstelensis TaxID=45462 RepID=UPI0030BFB12F
MTAYFKDLLAGVLAWWSINGAYKLFPVKGMDERGWEDGMALLMFKPIELIISVSLFFIASFLWGNPFLTHFLQMPLRTFSMDGLLHLIMCGYFAFIAYIQYVKMPFPTSGLLVILALVAIIKFKRQRAHYTEIAQLWRKK